MIINVESFLRQKASLRGNITEVGQARCNTATNSEVWCAWERIHYDLLENAPPLSTEQSEIIRNLASIGSRASFTVRPLKMGFMFGLIQPSTPKGSSMMVFEQ